MFDFLPIFHQKDMRINKIIYISTKNHADQYTLRPLDDLDSHSRAVFDERLKLRFWEISWFYN